MNTYINFFKSVVPKNQVPQKELLAWLLECHLKNIHQNTAPTLEEKERLKKFFQHYTVSPSQVNSRSIDLNFNELEGHDIQQGARLFAEKAQRALLELFNDSSIAPPEHIIHVTCTGYLSPSPVQRIASSLDWKKTEITHAYQMGCYASMPALRLASSLVKSKNNEKVDIVHNEICSLHLNPVTHSPEQLVVQSLFADGHIRYQISAEKNPQEQNLKMISIKEKIIPDSSSDMEWLPASYGMSMTLSKDVPKKMAAPLKGAFDELIRENNLSAMDLQRAIFAIHPGGPKIIDSVKEALELTEDQVKESRKVLYERGNMSSATLPHVWQEILKEKRPPKTHLISFAFGPGLTLYISLFEVC